MQLNCSVIDNDMSLKMITIILLTTAAVGVAVAVTTFIKVVVAEVEVFRKEEKDDYKFDYTENWLYLFLIIMCP